MRSVAPIVLIGAPRSGTKLLRDLIGAYPDADRVPYDINYVWRKGNEALPHDLLTPDLLEPAAAAFIRREILRFSNGAPVIVEKTVSNTIRVPFVRAVLPECRFVHLVRDGRDVAESIWRQWYAPPDWRYIAQKARTYPFRDAAGYAVSYGRKALGRALGMRAAEQSVWGVRYPGIMEDLQSMSVLEVAATQWVRCVDAALRDLAQLEAGSSLLVRYEDLVLRPESELERIAAFIGLGPNPALSADRPEVARGNVGKASHALSPAEMARVDSIVGPLMTVLERPDAAVLGAP